MAKEISHLNILRDQGPKKTDFYFSACNNDQNNNWAVPDLWRWRDLRNSINGSAAEQMPKDSDGSKPAQDCHALESGHLLDLYLSLTEADRRKHFIDTARAARLAGVSQRAIQLWIASGEIRALAIGKKYQVHLGSFTLYLKLKVQAWADK